MAQNYAYRTSAGEEDGFIPFSNYRLIVIFKNGEGVFIIPEYFAADNDAANASATKGTNGGSILCAILQILLMMTPAKKLNGAR